MTSGTGDQDAFGVVVQGGLVDSHAASGHRSHALKGVSEVFAEVGDHSVMFAVEGLK